MTFMLMGWPLVAQTGAENRKDMLDEASKEIAPLELKEIPASSLGEWKNAINSSLFNLFRRTELFRGPIRVLVIDDSTVITRLYPNGTFVISSGLLDYIDQSLFEETVDSPRRIRNFDAEREAAIIPFLAPETAHFALGHQLAAWNRSQGNGIEYTDVENTDADKFAEVLLKLAGLDSGTMEQSLASLSKKSTGGTLGPAFAGYLSPLPSPKKDWLRYAATQMTLTVSRENSASLSTPSGGEVRTAKQATDSSHLPKNFRMHLTLRVFPRSSHISAGSKRWPRKIRKYRHSYPLPRKHRRTGKHLWISRAELPQTQKE